MGIWDDSSFGNDEALDWMSRLDADDGLQPLRQIMHAATSTPAPALDLPQASRLLAAVELMAAAGGRPHPGLPERARRWCITQGEAPVEDDLILATRALDFVGTTSALAELWSQRSDVNGWHQQLDQLRMRLTPVRAPGA